MASDVTILDESENAIYGNNLKKSFMIAVLFCNAIVLIAKYVLPDKITQL